MKTGLITLVLTLVVSSALGQFRAVGVITGAGYTVVNIERAIDYSPLTDWDHFGVILKAFGEYGLKNGLILVGEFGSNRLYYWEYSWSDGYYGGYRWRSEWTTNVGVSLKKQLGETIFFQVGPGIHVFNDGSGVVPGLLLGIGYEYALNDQFSIPAGLRIESVFGSALPTSALVSVGLRYAF